MTARHDQFHLLMGEADWQVDEQSALHWDDAWGGISLRPYLQLYPREIEGAARPKGAARDRTSTWYWLDVAEDGRGYVATRAPGSDAPSRLWPPLPADSADAAGTLKAGDFHALPPPTPDSPNLHGLAITDDDYLVVGLPDSDHLLCFDLLGTAPPVRLAWSGRLPLIAMAPLPGGGLMILEGQEQPRLWQLDRNFRAVGAPAALPAQPSPLALAVLPDGSALVLGAGSGTTPAVVTRYRSGVPAGHAALTLPGHPLLACDIAFLPDPEPDLTRPSGTLAGALYVATAQEQQCFAFRLVAGAQDFTLALQLACLPTYWSRTMGIVATAGGVYYDGRGDWMPLREESQPRYETEGKIVLPPAPAGETAMLGFDGKAPDCVWHRIFLDASIPPGTSVRIETRAMNEGAWEAEDDWQEEPPVRLRPDGSELPYFRPFAAHGEQGGHSPHAGTYEVLLQNARGRYLQVRLSLSGSGRATPRIYALRAYYPRFSYLKRYLPPIYQNNPTATSFLDRFLANPEGILTDVEQQMTHSAMLLDPRTAPPEYLDWLAGWFGLGQAFGWDERRQRLFIAHAVQLFRSRGTLPGLVRAIRLGLEPDPTEAIFTDDIAPYTGYGASGAQGRPAFRIVEEFDGSHCFTVYLAVSPRGTPLDAAWVRRLVTAEQPAHTQFRVVPDWAAFRISSARLGADTILAESGRLAGMVLGEGALGDSYLTAPIPWETAGRAMVGQERIGRTRTP